MSCFRRTGVAHIASILLVIFGAVTLAAAPNAGHRSCKATQHDCGKPAKMASRCCGSPDQSVAQVAPMPLREDTSASTTILCGSIKTNLCGATGTFAVSAMPSGLPAIARLTLPLRL